MLTDNRNISTSRGVRNNNPLNLRKGVAFQYIVENPAENSFMTFGKTWQGIRAGVLDLTTDISKGKNTLTLLINEFAPPSENNTQNYIKNISIVTGLKPDEVIDRKNFTLISKLVAAMISMENGPAAKFVTTEDIFEGVKSAFIYRGYKLTPDANKTTTAPKIELISLFIGVVVVLFLLKLLIK
jgi:hypothetical protein